MLPMSGSHEFVGQFVCDQDLDRRVRGTLRVVPGQKPSIQVSGTELVATMDVRVQSNGTLAGDGVDWFTARRPTVYGDLEGGWVASVLEVLPKFSPIRGF